MGKRVAVFVLCFVVVFGFLGISIQNIEAEEKFQPLFEIVCEKNELEVSESTSVHINVQNPSELSDDINIVCYIKESFCVKLELIRDLEWTSEIGAKSRQQEYKITGMSPGETELVIRINNMEPHIVPIIVGQIKDVSKITVSPENPSVFVGDETQFSAKAFDDDGVEIPDIPIRWENLDPEFAELTPDGLFRAFKPGTCKIKASHGSVETDTIVSILKEIHPAELSFSSELIVFDRIQKDDVESTVVEIKNIGDLKTEATIKCDAKWLTFAPEKISLEPQESTQITFTANPKSLDSNSMEKAKVIFTLNNGTEKTIDVIIRVMPNCKISIEPEILDFSSIKRTEDVSKTLKVSLSDGVHAWVVPSEPWISVSKIESTKSDFTVTIDTSNLPGDSTSFEGEVVIIPTDIFCGISSVKVLVEIID